MQPWSWIGPRVIHPGLSKKDLVERGRRLFFEETFEGNGRTCGTRYPATNNFTIDPDFIARLSPDDPLFVNISGPGEPDPSADTLKEAIAFYNSDLFANSPAGRFGPPFDLSDDEIDAIGAPLRVLNALENIRYGKVLSDAAQRTVPPAAAMARVEEVAAESRDAFEALTEGPLRLLPRGRPAAPGPGAGGASSRHVSAAPTQRLAARCRRAEAAAHRRDGRPSAIQTC